MDDSDDDVPPLEDAWTVDNSLTDCPLGDAYLAAIKAFNLEGSSRHINDLPTELIANILKLAPVFFHTSPPSYEGSRHVLRMVSPLWNTVVEAEPSLWSQIYVGQHTPIRKLDRWIERARSVPLSFAFYLAEPSNGPTLLEESSHYRPKWNRLMDAIRPTMARCTRVSIQANNPPSTGFILAMLNSVDALAVERIDLRLCPYTMHVQRRIDLVDPLHQIFAVPPLFSSNTPHLRHLTFRGFFTTWDVSSILSNVTNLHLEDLQEQFTPTVDEIFAVLGAASRLVTLFFLDVMCVGFDIYTREPPVMAFLEVLHFAGSDSSCSCLLSLVSMPAITTLHLQLHGDRSIQLFLQHCDALCGRVTKLSIDIYLGAIQTLVDIFEAFLRLEFLDARGMHAYFSIALHSIASHWVSLCPALSTILIDEYMEPPLLQLILSRSNTGLFGKRPMRIVSLVEFDNAGERTIPCTATVENGVQEDGPHVKVIYPPKRRTILRVMVPDPAYRMQATSAGEDSEEDDSSDEKSSDSSPTECGGSDTERPSDVSPPLSPTLSVASDCLSTSASDMQPE
ncbi:hypothetical protein B0H16DRAFT_1732720 [Mycena metata]|uniref:F-box domain-containing protein n=1 Tax=Mycena metata TaxID=1033252 RepID=A0AAD7MVJ2_9AGAR|nr:hypothetical protein B0H16DRAFT_1732720 [Mycena metata]